MLVTSAINQIENRLQLCQAMIALAVNGVSEKYDLSCSLRTPVASNETLTEDKGVSLCCTCSRQSWGVRENSGQNLVWTALSNRWYQRCSYEQFRWGAYITKHERKCGYHGKCFRDCMRPLIRIARESAFVPVSWRDTCRTQLLRDPHT